MAEDADDIQKACQLVTARRLCREQAVALYRCYQEHNGQAAPCQSEQVRFSACANESMPQIIRLLMHTASERCPSDVAAFRRCVKENGGGSLGEERCESLDVKALHCAARALLQPGAVDAAVIPPPGSEWS